MRDPEIIRRVMDRKTGGETVIAELVMPHLRDSYEDLSGGVRRRRRGGRPHAHLRGATRRGEDGHPLGLLRAAADLSLLRARPARHAHVLVLPPPAVPGAWIPPLLLPAREADGPTLGRAVAPLPCRARAAPDSGQSDLRGPALPRPKSWSSSRRSSPRRSRTGPHLRSRRDSRSTTAGAPRDSPPSSPASSMPDRLRSCSRWGRRPSAIPAASTRPARRSRVRSAGAPCSSSGSRLRYRRRSRRASRRSTTRLTRSSFLAPPRSCTRAASARHRRRCDRAARCW